ncbi:MAG TPA: hypothetical protein VHY36_17505 [Steroidobacteraceae bacterium]|jgi:hypothetical protein|nr:hypothetical protein [Steroidobacteraceae bacterium]
MPARWQSGLALLALAMAGQVWAAPLNPRAAIARCAAQAGPMPRGIAALNKACPGVEDALAQLQLTAFMPTGWRKTLTAGGLTDVDTLLQRYSESQPEEPLRAAALRSIAAALVPRQPPVTWTGRIEAWIRHTLLQPLGRWLRSLGPRIRSTQHPQAIFFGLTALLLIAAVAVLAFELRGSGLTRLLGRPALPPRRRRSAADSTASPEPDWTHLRAQPARLLRLLVETLTRAHRLERERHLTCRELEAQARFDTEMERAGFAQVARLAEREIYGPPGIVVLADETLRDVRTMHDRLLATGKGGDAAQ